LAPPHRVLIVSEHPYPDHATLRRNVVQLLDEGMAVDLLCLAGSRKLDEGPQARTGLRVYRMHLEHRRTPAYRYVLEYVAFFVWALPIAFALSLRNRYAVVLIDNMPDFLVFVAFVARLRRARVVLEMFELTPELTAARLQLGHSHPALRFARWLERIATRWADHLIVVSRQCMEILVARGVDAARISVLPNTPPIAATPALADNGEARPTFIVTHCSLVERYGVQVAIRALTLLGRDWPDLTLRVLGDGEYKATLVELADELGVGNRVVFRGFVPWADAMQEIRAAAVGIVAIIADGYGELLFPTKLLEYVEHDVPVASARLPTIADHFPSDTLAYFEPGDAAGLARQINGLLRDRGEAEAQARRAKAAMRSFRWDALAPRYMAALGFQTAAVTAAPVP
jgi:glycosyltransferase involved in cell wall biosynthesis